MIRNAFIFIGVIAAFLIIACQGNKNEKALKNIVSTDDFVTSHITNKDGKTLEVLFNNTKGTATFYYNGDTVEMMQDTVASGIKYSNDQYEYIEWHGEITLKKENEIVFEHKDKK